MRERQLRRSISASETRGLPAMIVAQAVTLLAKPTPTTRLARDSPRICEVNIQGGLHASGFCSQMPDAEYVGIAFNPNATMVPLSLELERALSTCASHQLIAPGPSLYSARVVSNPILALNASCDVIVVNMDAPTAAARQTLISDLPMALSLASQTMATFLVLVGHGCDASMGNVDRAGNLIYDAGAQYVNWQGHHKMEQCWIQDAWRTHRARGLVKPPPVRQPNECERIGTRLWCAGEIAPTIRAACRLSINRHSALLEYTSAAKASRCETVSSVVRFSGAMPPDWDPTTNRQARSLLYRKFDSLVRKSIQSYTIVPCGRKGDTPEQQQATMCLIFPNGGDPDRWVAGLVSTNGGLTFDNGPAHLVMPSISNDSVLQHPGVPYHMTVNLAIARENGDGQYVVVGGRYRAPLDEEQGVWMASGTSWRWSSSQEPRPPEYAGRGAFRGTPVPPRDNWGNFRLLFNGTHEGCIDSNARYLFKSRDTHGVWVANVCGFTGRLSLVQHGTDWLIYTRARISNGRAMDANGNGRQWVQMTRSSHGHEWQPFQQIQILHLQPALASLSFFAVQTNPVHSGSLLALVPLVHCTHAYVGITFSVDGLTWSPVVPLVQAAAWLASDGEHASSQPVAGGLRSVGNGRVACFIHQDIPRGGYEQAIPVTRETPLVLAKWAEKRLHQRAPRPPSSIMRIEFPCSRLALWTRRGLQDLPGRTAAQNRASFSACVVEKSTKRRRQKRPQRNACDRDA